MKDYEFVVTVKVANDADPNDVAANLRACDTHVKAVSEARIVHANPFTGEPVTHEQREKNGRETIRWYQILTRTSDPVMLRNRMDAQGLLNADNDPKLRRVPKP